MNPEYTCLLPAADGNGPRIGNCVKLCNQTDASTCDLAQGSNACGCPEELDCTEDIAGNDMDLDGVCTPPTEPGDACGLDLTTGVTQLCSFPQTCNQMAGLCEGGDAPADGGTPDAG